MKNIGNLKLNIDGESKNVNYSIIDDKIIITASSNNNNLDKIKKNPKVTINLTDKEYNAKIIEGKEAIELRKQVKASLPSFTKLTDEILGNDQVEIIVLTEIN